LSMVQRLGCGVFLPLFHHPSEDPCSYG
jgi:hypothetical protein